MSEVNERNDCRLVSVEVSELQLLVVLKYIYYIPNQHFDICRPTRAAR